MRDNRWFMTALAFVALGCATVPYVPTRTADDPGCQRIANEHENRGFRESVLERAGCPLDTTVTGSLAVWSCRHESGTDRFCARTEGQAAGACDEYLMKVCRAKGQFACEKGSTCTNTNIGCSDIGRVQ